MAETRDGDAPFDIIFAGGGLANVLAAYRLAKTQPHVRFLVLDANKQFGSIQTWSFHSTDISAHQLEWMKPFIAYHWPSQRVVFPKRERELDIGYNTITLESFQAEAMPVLEPHTRFNARIEIVEPTRVVLSDGTEYRAHAVIDGRGAVRDPNLTIAFQKFLGIDIRTKQPHGETIPTIMDATVPQIDGYRFVYTLPYDTHRILVEDTYYSDGDALTKEALRERVHAYAADKGWEIDEIEREEYGVLPVALDGNIKAYLDTWPHGLARSGMRAAYFHQTTGYSLPDAVRFADDLAEQNLFEANHIAQLSRERTRKIWSGRAFFRMINRVLFLAPKQEERYRILQRFYGLPQGLISRFYASELTLKDQIRILSGDPPVSILDAMKCLPPSAVRRAGRHGHDVTEPGQTRARPT